jgi:hypothetical protein
VHAFAVGQRAELRLHQPGSCVDEQQQVSVDVADEKGIAAPRFSGPAEG